MTTEHGLNWKTTGRTHKDEVEYIAEIPTGSKFWAVWFAKKELIKATGLRMWKTLDGRFLANIWNVPLRIETAEAPLEPLLQEIDYSGLLPWQHRCVSDIVRSIRLYGAALDASDVGTGKTYSAIKAFQHMQSKRLLVVCPKSVVPSWHRAAKHFGTTIEVINYEMVRRCTTPYTTGTLKDNTMRWVHTIDGIIFDEAHKCKGMTSLNSRLLLQAKKDKINTLMLSATVACNPLELKAVGFSLGFFVGTKSQSEWLQMMGCWVKPDAKGYKPDPTVMRNISRYIFPKYGCRARVADLGDAFPETFISTDYLPVTTDAAKLIDEAYAAAAQVKTKNDERDANLATIQGIKANTDTTSEDSMIAAAEMIKAVEERITEYESPMAAMMHCRQVSEAAKVPAVVEQALDAVENGSSAVIFVNFISTVTALQTLLEHENPAIVRGGQKAEDREADIARFQANETRVIILNIDAGGTGVSLHDLHGGFPRMSFIFPSYSAVTLRQALGRVHRAGGLTKSIQKILFAAGTIEEQIAVSVDRKLKCLDALNDGDMF